MKQRLQSLAHELVRLREDGAIRPEHDARFAAVQVAVGQLIDLLPQGFNIELVPPAPPAAKKTGGKRR